MPDSWEDPSSPGGEPLSEDALGIGIEDISADPSVGDLYRDDAVSPTLPENETNYGDAGPSLSDLFGNDDFHSTLPVDDDFSPDFIHRPEDGTSGGDIAERRSRRSGQRRGPRRAVRSTGRSCFHVGLPVDASRSYRGVGWWNAASLG